MAYCSEDHEEVFHKHGVVKPNSIHSLAGIVDIYKLAQAGYVEDTLECARNGESIQLGLSGACQGGHIDLARLLNATGECDLDWGMVAACIGGHEEIVSMMIKLGACDWDWALETACFKGHQKLISLMIQKGATKCNECHKPICKH
jgi:hypothetical protein